MRSNCQREMSHRTICRWIEEGVLPRGSQLPAERDLCKRLGVSLSSVHRAVADLEREKIVVRKSPRIRMVAAGGEPGPVRNRILHNTVVVVSPKYREDSPMYFRRPGWGYYNYIALLVAVQNKGFNTLLVSPEGFDADIDTYLRSRPAGVVFTENEGRPPAPDTQIKLVRAAIPFVAYGDFPGMDRVTCDHAAGTYELAKHLIMKGCRRIAMVIQEPHRDGYWIQNRLAGLKRAVAEAGLESLPPLFEMPFQGGGRTAEEHFGGRARFSAGCLAPVLLGRHPPDALMLLSDWLVPQIAAACEILGRRPNRDILIAGYDHFYDETPDFLLNPVPPAATVDKHLAESGRKMAELLFARAAGELPPEPQRILITPQLIPVEMNPSLP